MNNYASGLPWRIRAVQIDLARQMETIDFVKRYADRAAAFGFNALVLYVEGRVRTDSFPYPPADASYSLTEMAKIVQHASDVGVDVILHLPTLAHCEQFVRYPQLAQLAEERAGASRFGGSTRSTLCPSQEETYVFLERYLTELTQVFTGPYVHVGCDEAFNLGFCDICEPRRRQGGLAGIYLPHIQRMAAITANLGKRMIMADDMFEMFPERLVEIPRETIMCHWCYDPTIEREGCNAHFGNLWRQDWLAEYERLGFDALISPWVIRPQNIVAITDYARHHRVLGGLLTQWEEKKEHFHDEAIPTVAFTGDLWRRETFDVDAAWAHSLPKVIRPNTQTVDAAVRTLSELPRPFPALSIQRFLTGALSVQEYTQRTAMQAGLDLLRVAQDGLSVTHGHEVLQDLEISTRISALTCTLRELLPAIYHPRRPPSDVPRLRRMAEQVRRTLSKCESIRTEKWQETRRGIAPESAGQYVRDLQRVLEPAWERLNREPIKSDWWLILRLFLADENGREQIRVTIMADGDDQLVLEGCFKPEPLPSGGSPFYTMQVPFSSDKTPDAVRIEVCGYGGQGVAFFEAQNPCTTLMPSAILGARGQVSCPEAVLRDDSRWTFMGHYGYDEALHDPVLASNPASLLVSLEKRD